MLQVESSVACKGTNGEYKLWVHYLTRHQTARFVELDLPENPIETEGLLKLPVIEDQFAVFSALEKVSGQAEKIRELQRPALATVVRYCGRKAHANGAQTHGAVDYAERAASIIWVPKVPDTLPKFDVYPHLTSFDDQNIGQTRAQNNVIGNTRPVVSIPLTPEEQTAFDSGSAPAQMVLAQSPEDVLGDIFAMIHATPDGLPIEQVFVMP